MTMASPSGMVGKEILGVCQLPGTVLRRRIYLAHERPLYKLSVQRQHQLNRTGRIGLTSQTPKIPFCQGRLLVVPSSLSAASAS